MERFYLEALIMGLLICVAVIGLQSLLGEASGMIRFVALVIVGALLCGIQYGIGRSKRH
ncbi:MAG: hypothetical protein HC822_19520 [Oscillochloris sp.]|nr:hypothetical protein [Oscillochloris sp.]